MNIFKMKEIYLNYKIKNDFKQYLSHINNNKYSLSGKREEIHLSQYKMVHLLIDYRSIVAIIVKVDNNNKLYYHIRKWCFHSSKIIRVFLSMRDCTKMLWKKLKNKSLMMLSKKEKKWEFVLSNLIVVCKTISIITIWHLKHHKTCNDLPNKPNKEKTPFSLIVSPSQLRSSIPSWSNSRRRTKSCSSAPSNLTSTVSRLRWQQVTTRIRNVSTNVSTRRANRRTCLWRTYRFSRSILRLTRARSSLRPTILRTAATIG